MVPRTILACCVLHNICLMIDDEDISNFILDGEEQAQQSSSSTEQLLIDFEIEGEQLREVMADDVFCEI